MLEWLEGKKTYIVAIATALFNLGCALGWWAVDNAYWSAINAVFASLFGITLRAGVAKSK